jgi:hypothetical protein
MVRSEAIPLLRSNDMRISCGPSSPRPHKLTFRGVLTGRCARAEPGTVPARRLQARVRRRRFQILIESMTATTESGVSRTLILPRYPLSK